MCLRADLVLLDLRKIRDFWSLARVFARVLCAQLFIIICLAIAKPPMLQHSLEFDWRASNDRKRDLTVFSRNAQFSRTRFAEISKRERAIIKFATQHLQTTNAQRITNQ